ncbi:MAG: hypothetical protein M3Q62_06315 [Actinomycetota bacterium]|nr:hypothetical protein [Rubrobacteraceae bacterium]MBA3701574.1 hypothetical protein [Rubrobacteraceae bacterium]MDQ3183146.1 hypothetical protein [Actinomycetota bacterium]MDQ3499350.1 hypothetical protein [Actinomycetota bacterium]
MADSHVILDTDPGIQPFGFGVKGGILGGDNGAVRAGSDRVTSPRVKAITVRSELCATLSRV